MILLGMGRLSDKCIKSEVELFIISAIVCRLAGILGVWMSLAPSSVVWQV